MKGREVKEKNREGWLKKESNGKKGKEREGGWEKDEREKGRNKGKKEGSEKG